MTDTMTAGPFPAEVVRSLPLEADDVDIVGRRLEGAVFAWDTPYRVTDDGGRSWYEEGYRRGACERSITSRRNTFELRAEHADVRLGLVAFTEGDEGLLFLARMDSTDDGDRELEHLRAHQREGVSIRYTPLRNNPRKGPPWWRSQMELRELSLTERPQITGAKVMAIRSHPPAARTYERPADIAVLLDYRVPDLGED